VNLGSPQTMLRSVWLDREAMIRRTDLSMTAWRITLPVIARRISAVCVLRAIRAASVADQTAR
jgi:hypothetical protein